MVKIKRYDATTELTTRPTGPVVNPQEYTQDMKAFQNFGNQLTKTANYFYQVNTLKQQTESQIAFNKIADEVEQEMAKDQDFETIPQRSSEILQKAKEKAAAYIQDEQARNEFLLVTDNRQRAAQNRINTSASKRLLGDQKDKYEVYMDQTTAEINELNRSGRYAEAAALAQETLPKTDQMIGTGVIDQETGLERHKTFVEAISGKGQSDYDIEHMVTSSDMDAVEARLENNTYKMDLKSLGEQKEAFKKIRKNLEGDMKTVQEIQYGEKLAKIVDNEDKLTIEQQIAAVTEGIKRGAAGLDGGVDPILGEKVKKQLIEQGKTLTDQRTFQQKAMQPMSEFSINMSYNNLNLDNNTVTADREKKILQESDDGSLAQVKDHYKHIVDLLDQKFITPKIAGAEMAKAFKLYNRREEEIASGLWKEKQAAAKEANKALGFSVFDTKEERAIREQNKKVLEGTGRDYINTQKAQLMNIFFDELEEATSTQEVKNVLNRVKENYVTQVAPQTLNVKDAVPNGVASQTKQAVQISDQPVVVEADENFVPPEGGRTSKTGMENGRKVMVIFENGVPVDKVFIDGN